MARVGRLAAIAYCLVVAGLALKPAAAAPMGGNIYDGEYMAAICSSNADSHRETCRANVITVAYAMAYNTVEGFRACVPIRTATWGGITASVTRWLYANPDSWGLSVVGIIAAALSETYPCP